MRVNLIERVMCWQVARRFRGYRPQAVTAESVALWLEQYTQADRPAILKLLKTVTYYPEDATTKRLVQLNDKLTEKLAGAGIDAKSLIYVQIHEAGSSSPVTLNALRDAARLERKGCKLLDGKDARGLHKATSELDQGAIIYVDDFVATGNQFCAARDFAADYIVGNFAEFLLVPCICEEAIYELAKRGVEAFPGMIHAKQDRPLHPESTLWDEGARTRLTTLCNEIDDKGGLGYKKLATMVVFFRNAPNTVPLLIRGSLGQTPWRGVLPRTTDL